MRTKCIHYWQVSPEIKHGFSEAKCLKCGAVEQMPANWESISRREKRFKIHLTPEQKWENFLMHIAMEFDRYA